MSRQIALESYYKFMRVFDNTCVLLLVKSPCCSLPFLCLGIDSFSFLCTEVQYGYYGSELIICMKVGQEVKDGLLQEL